MAEPVAQPTPRVGRDLEPDALAEPLDAMLAGRGSLCIVSGDTGVGKSTLLRAFAARTEQAQVDLVTAWGHCDQQSGSSTPLLPWKDLLQSLAGVTEVSVPAERLRDAGGALKSVRSTFIELAPDLIELLVPGIGLVIRSAKLISKKTSLSRRLGFLGRQRESASVEADRAQLQDQYVAILERVSEEAPVLLFIDDLHCADVASLQLLERIVRVMGERRLMIVAACRAVDDRTTEVEALTNIRGGLSELLVDLDSARDRRGAQFVVEYVQAVIPGMDDAFTRELARHTGGHPLFVSEVVAHLQAHGELLDDAGAWRLEREVDWLAVPTRVESVLSEQLAGLDEVLTDALSAASVEGDQFTVEVLAPVLGQTPMQVARLLARHAPRNLVEPLGTTLIGGNRTTRFRFCHSLAHNHVYGTIDPVERVYLHEGIGNALEALAGDDAHVWAAQLAYHFDRAELQQRARDYYLQAATHASSLCAMNEAVAHLSRARELTGDDEHIRVHVLRALGSVLTMVGKASDAAALLDEAVAIGERTHDEALAMALVDQARTLAHLHQLEASEASARRAETVAGERDDAQMLARALRARACSYTLRGEHGDALALLQQVVELVRTIDDDFELANALTDLGWSLKELGRYAECERALRESLAIQESTEGGNWSLYAGTHNAFADLNISLENYPAAREHLEVALETWQRFDQHVDATIALTNHANLANRQGLFAEALEYGKRGYAIDQAVLGDDHPVLAFALTCMGESQIGLSDYEAALATLSQADALRTQHEVPSGNLEWTRWLLGRALVESGQDPEAGMSKVAEARATFESMGDAAASELADINTWLDAIDD